MLVSSKFKFRTFDTRIPFVHQNDSLHLVLYPYLTDPHIVEHLARFGEQAATAMFVNCDSEGCELMEGIHEGDAWYFEGKGPAVGADHSQMLGMSMEDTE